MAKLSVDTLEQAEYELGLQAGVSMGIFSQKTADTAAKINSMTDMVIKGKLNVELLRSAIESLRDRDISINVAIQGAYASQFQSNQQSNAASNPEHTYSTPGRATGGSVMAGRPYMVGEAGRELFVPSQNGNIVPNDKLGSGGGTVINLTYAPAFSAATRDEMQNILLPFILEGIRPRLCQFPFQYLIHCTVALLHYLEHPFKPNKRAFLDFTTFYSLSHSAE